MIKQMIGAAIGSKMIKSSPATGGAVGTVIGTALPFVLSRMRLSTMVMLGAGGYLAKRYLDEREAEETAQDAKDVSGVAKKKPARPPRSKTGSVIDPPPGGATKG